MEKFYLTDKLIHRMGQFVMGKGQRTLQWWPKASILWDTQVMWCRIDGLKKERKKCLKKLPFCLGAGAFYSLCFLFCCKYGVVSWWCLFVVIVLWHDGVVSWWRCDMMTLCCDGAVIWWCFVVMPLFCVGFYQVALCRVAFWWRILF